VDHQAGKKKYEKKIETQIENQDLVRKKHLQIVKAAGELFSQKGYHQTSMRDIAAAAGINLAYIYKYITSKDDILYLFYQHLHEQWTDVYAQLTDAKDENPVAQLKKFIEDILEVALKQKSEILTMYTESRHLEKDSLYAVLSAESEMVRCIEQVIIRGQNAGCFKVQDSYLAANLIQFLMVVGPLRGWNFEDRYTFQRYVHLLTDFILAALGVDEEAEERQNF